MARRFVLTVLTLVLASRVVAAQSARGQLTDSLTGAAIGGGFVVLLDSLGSEVARSLTVAGGRFALSAPAPGRYRVRTEAVGYRAWESEPVALPAGATVDLDLRIAALPIRLDAVEITGETRCRSPRGGPDVAALWDEARKALSAAAWTAHEVGYRSLLHRYRRRRDVRGHLADAGDAWVLEGSALQPFASIPPGELARRGYVVARSNVRRYHGPDANVLLDESFHQTHCFEAVRGAGEFAGLLGLAFRPIPERGVPDIEGILWIDPVSAELRSIEYRYTDLPLPVRDERIGGSIGFQRLRSGTWILERWELRIPLLGSQTRVVAPGVRRTEPVLAGIREAGGAVIEVRDLDGVLEYQSPSMALIEGIVFDSIRGRALAGEPVTVDGTGYTTRTDSLGRFTLKTLLAGEYRLTSARLDSLGYAPGRVTRMLRPGGSFRADLTIPPLDRVHRHLCGGRLLEIGEYVVHGTVRDERADEPLPDVPVTVSWLAPDLDAARPTEIEVRTDERGWYHVCGVPSNRRTRIEVPLRNFEVQPREFLFRDGQVHLFLESGDRVHAVAHRVWQLDLALRPLAEGR